MRARQGLVVVSCVAIRRLRLVGCLCLLASTLGALVCFGNAQAASAATLIQGFNEPDAVAVDPSANIWVADSGHNRVLEFNSERKYVRQFGTEGTEDGQFKGIQGIATDASGDVYVTGSNRVQEFSPSGAYLRKFGSTGSGNGQFYSASDITVDSSGNVWVLDTFNFRVQEFSATGEYLGQFGSKGTGNGQLGSGLWPRVLRRAPVCL